MSKYAMAKELILQGFEQGKAFSLDEADVVEVLITAAVQDLIRTKGGAYTRQFLQYEKDSVASDFFEIQKR
tara:strand:- start:1701 stop:1913 length:213 start_codon:yes stop_codon:yes gene_type:complete